MRTIVLATDGSPTAEEATAVAVELARDAGARLCVAAAWEAPLTIYPYAPMSSVPEIQRAETARATEAARVALERAKEAGVEAESFVREGDPVDVVSETARNTGASLIVVGSHGWGPVRRVVFGSVSMSLLHEAPCPVLVARHDASKTHSSATPKEKARA